MMPRNRRTRLGRKPIKLPVEEVAEVAEGGVGEVGGVAVVAWVAVEEAVEEVEAGAGAVGGDSRLFKHILRKNVRSLGCRVAEPLNAQGQKQLQSIGSTLSSDGLERISIKLELSSALYSYRMYFFFSRFRTAMDL